MGVNFAFELVEVGLLMEDITIQKGKASKETMLEDLTAVIVDDSEYALCFIEDATKMLGINVKSFQCPLEALKYVKTNPVDMICTDFKMPKMDGLTFIREARKVHHDIPVVMFTGEAEYEDLRERSQREGVAEFFVKPIPVVTFFDRVKPLAELRQYLKFMGAYKQKDDFGNHRVRVGHFSKIIAGALNWDSKDQEMIYYGAQAHDIGMISIPDSILLKASGLAWEEMDLIRKHPVIGHSVLQGYSNPYFKMAATISLTHHERFDGSGYPFGFSGDVIPAAGRIVGLTDAFDVLTSVRPHKTAWSFEKAFSYISVNSDMNFDPEIVNVFTENVDRIKDVFTRFAD